MSIPITRVEIRFEEDLVRARQQARLIAGLLGFDHQDQTRLGTAVSEIVRNAYQYAGGGEVEFMLDGKAPAQQLGIKVRDHGPGIAKLDVILEGRYTSSSGMGMGIVGSRRLMDQFQIESRPGAGTTVFLAKTLPSSAPEATPAVLRRIADALAAKRTESPLDESRAQNQELLRTMDELRQRQEELLRLNQELEDTNRGVVALYAELDEKAVQLARASELKTRFLANMSHVFRTPLHSILALSRLMLDRADGELTPEQDKQMVFIRSAAEVLSGLMNDLLDLSKIEAGRTVMRPHECSVADIFSGLRGMFKPMLTDESVALSFEYPSGIPALYTDDARVSQILRNFVSNALKFTTRGEIRVSARLTPDDQAVRLAVADTGIGIEAADQARLFQDYVQVDGVHQTHPGGTGLGLSISKRLAEMLGGSVGVDSQPGLGSTFWAVIPLRYSESADADADLGVAQVVPDRTRHPVLMVEDDPSTMLLYEKYLKGSGFQCLPASSVHMARLVLLQMRPIAVVLDILLSGSESWYFIGELKANPATREIPVIVVSMLDEPERGLALGADDYCIKPVDRAWLLGKLQTLARSAPIETLLVIDDEEVARYVIKSHLADTKYQVVEASNGEDGLRLAASAQPSVIILDLAMPGLDGYEVLARLKANPATRAIPVIINTSRLLEEADLKALRGGALAILSKEAPSREASLQQLGEALRRAVDLNRHSVVASSDTKGRNA